MATLQIARFRNPRLPAQQPRITEESPRSIEHSQQASVASQWQQTWWDTRMDTS